MKRLSIAVLLLFLGLSFGGRLMAEEPSPAASRNGLRIFFMLGSSTTVLKKLA